MIDTLRQMPPDHFRVVMILYMGVSVAVLALVLVVDVLKWLTERKTLRRQEELNELTRDNLRVSQRINDDTRHKADRLEQKADEVRAVAHEVKKVVAAVVSPPTPTHTDLPPGGAQR